VITRVLETRRGAEQKEARDKLPDQGVRLTEGWQFVAGFLLRASPHHMGGRLTSKNSNGVHFEEISE